MPWLHTRKWDRNNRVAVPITRWVNDFPRNRLNLDSLPKVLADYASARAKNYSKEDAAAYAMACKEACWHSASHVAFKDKASDNKWWHTARINKEYTLERFLRVLGNTLSLGKSLGIHTLETVCGIVPDLRVRNRWPRRSQEYVPYHGWIGQHFNMDSPRGVEVRKLHEKYKSIACRYLNLSGYSLLTNRHVLRRWKKVKRGRDLFVKGWGAFDICGIGQYVYEEQLVPSPLDFTAMGYGLFTYNLKRLMADEWLMQYVTRWRHWWWAPIHDGDAPRLPRMDEIIRAKNAIDRDYPNEVMYGPTGLIRDMSVHPQHILDIVGEYRARQQAEYKKRNVPLQDEWPWVMEAMQPVETGVGTLVPIDTLADLQETSKVLNNCASGYAMDIQTKRCALVKLVEDGIPIALAEYSHMGKLNQCSGVSNRKVSKEIRQVFESYKPRWQDK